MKYLFLIFLLFTSFSKAFSQNEEIDSLVINPKSVIAVSNLNVLYRGIENPMRIAVPGVEKDKIFIAAEKGNVRKGWLENEYVYYSDSNGFGGYQLETISVFKINKTDTILIGKHIYRLKNLPKPEIQVGAIDRNGKTPISKFKSANYVYAIVNNCALQYYMFDVKSFTIELIKTSGDTITYTNNKGNIIESDFSMELRNVKTGDKIILKDVYMKNSPTGIVSKSKQILEAEVE